jgi:hypothetical protein
VSLDGFSGATIPGIPSFFIGIFVFVIDPAHVKPRNRQVLSICCTRKFVKLTVYLHLFVH